MSMTGDTNITEIPVGNNHIALLALDSNGWWRKLVDPIFIADKQLMNNYRFPLLVTVVGYSGSEDTFRNPVRDLNTAKEVAHRTYYDDDHTPSQQVPDPMSSSL